MLDFSLPLSAYHRSFDPRPHLVTAARSFYQRGWMVGTAGNLSAQLLDKSFWISASGRAKGNLSADDFIRIGTDSKVIEQSSPGIKPSAETAIHRVIYDIFPDAEVCYHIHSIEANLVSRFVDGDSLPLPPLEMLKGLGVWEEEPTCYLPVFKNYAQVSKIANEIGDRFRQSPPQIPALLIRDHGVTLWAPSLDTGNYYLESLDYIFRYMISAQQLGLS
jgi:methylthioribulose-1-phosphate dehydratase